MAASVSRGDVWRIDFNPTRGHEQQGVRPAVVLSSTIFNRGPAGLLVVVPITTKDKRVPLHVAIDPPEGGLRARSYAMCDQIRTVTTERLVERWGTLSDNTLPEIEDRVRTLLEL
jgi:mRNA interferase MazF